MSDAAFGLDLGGGCGKGLGAVFDIDGGPFGLAAPFKDALVQFGGGLGKCEVEHPEQHGIG